MSAPLILTRGQTIRWWLMRECMSFYVQCIVLQCYEAIVVPTPVYGSLWILLWSFVLPIIMQFLVLQDDDEYADSTLDHIWLVCWWTVQWICWFVTFWSMIFVGFQLLYALWTLGTSAASSISKEQPKQERNLLEQQLHHAALIFNIQSTLWLGWINTCPPMTVNLRRVPLPRLLFCYEGSLRWRPSDPTLCRNEYFLG